MRRAAIAVLVAVTTLVVPAAAAPASAGARSGLPLPLPSASPTPAPAPTGTGTTAPLATGPKTACSGNHCGGYFQTSAGTGQSTLLAWQIYTPDPAKWGPGPYPAVLDYSGYEPATTFFDGIKDTFLNQGYAVAGVNVRGTGCSGGKFDYFEPVEWQDGYDAIEFLATVKNTNGTQLVNGNVAMVGKSYPGITPVFVAPTQPPHLRAIVPGAFFSDSYRDVGYPGGIQNVVFVAGWSLASQPANTADQVFGGLQGLDQNCISAQVEHGQSPPHNPFITMNTHPFDDADPYHDRGPYLLANKSPSLSVKVPVLAQLAWQDEELAARGIDYVNRLPATTPWRAVLMNGAHDAYYGQTSLSEIFRFLSFYLKKQVPAGDACTGTYAAALACYQAEPRVAILNDVDQSKHETFVHRHATWPVTDTVDRFYLRSDGRLTHDGPGAAEPATSYAYVPGIGSNSYGTKREFQSRIPGDDIDFWQERPPAGTTASFTTPTFTKDALYTGNGSVDLWLSSTAADTDLEVMLTELRPDGNGGWLEEYVQKGWLRASHRKLDDAQSTPLRPYQTHQATDVQPLVPGTPTAMRVELFPFSQVVRAGRRLRITIEAPSIKPELWGFAALPTAAQNTIYTDAVHSSSLALPLVPLEPGTTFAPEAPCGVLGTAATGFTRQLTNQPCRADAAVAPGPDVPEVPYAVLLPFAALLIGGTALYRRRLKTARLEPTS
jgi:putative CocE/NonD family hydrolase